MMTKEDVAGIMTHCQEKGISYKTRLAELGIPEWRFYESKSRYAREQESEMREKGEFLQLTSGSEFVPMRSFAAKTGRKAKDKKEAQSRMLSIELRTSNGTMMRIQGELSQQCLQAIIQASSGRV